MTRARRPLAPPLAMPLDPRTLDERLWEIDLVNLSDFDTDAYAFAEVKRLVFELRKDIAKAAAGV